MSAKVDISNSLQVVEGDADVMPQVEDGIARLIINLDPKHRSSSITESECD